MVRMVKKVKYRFHHYIMFHRGRKLTIEVSNERISRSELKEPEHPDMLVVNIAKTPEEFKYWDRYYYRHPEDPTYHLIPDEDVMSLGTEPYKGESYGI